LVGTDNFYIPYEIMVQAFNDLGDGPNSTVTIVYSAMGSKYRPAWSIIRNRSVC